MYQALIFATPIYNSRKSQFAKVLPYYGFQMDSIVSVHQLVSNAIVLGNKQ